VAAAGLAARAAHGATSKSSVQRMTLGRCSLHTTT
jgi:hypothetical protein